LNALWHIIIITPAVNRSRFVQY